MHAPDQPDYHPCRSTGSATCTLSLARVVTVRLPPARVIMSLSDYRPQSHRRYRTANQILFVLVAEPSAPEAAGVRSGGHKVSRCRHRPMYDHWSARRCRHRPAATIADPWLAPHCHRQTMAGLPQLSQSRFWSTTDIAVLQPARRRNLATSRFRSVLGLPHPLPPAAARH